MVVVSSPSGRRPSASASYRLGSLLLHTALPRRRSRVRGVPLHWCTVPFLICVVPFPRPHSRCVTLGNRWSGPRMLHNCRRWPLRISFTCGWLPAAVSVCSVGLRRRLLPPGPALPYECGRPSQSADRRIRPARGAATSLRGPRLLSGMSRCRGLARAQRSPERFVSV